MENAVGFLFIPAPIWRGSQEGVTPPPPTTTPKLTQLGRGGGEASGPRGWGSRGFTWRSRGDACKRGRQTVQQKQWNPADLLSYSNPWLISQEYLSLLWPVICAAVYLWKIHHLLQPVICALYLWTDTYCISTGDSSPSVDWYLLYLYGRSITFCRLILYLYGRSITFCRLILTASLREIHHLL